MYNYNLIQKVLHSLVLGNRFINKSLFEIEKIFFLKNQNIKENKHVFISGLPRSGTTLLLNILYSSGEFASLKYSNMPFILSPNISNFIPVKKISKKERYHKDGIFFDLESPEAFDEIFFKVFSKENEKSEFYNFIKLILKSQKKNKYLSKNNLNFKRFKTIESIVPNSKFLIPIREPYQHSSSLYKQHINFLKLQEKDNFVRKYMNYLNHNEFGFDHKPWNTPKQYKDPKNINYWLEQWFLFYTNIYEKFSKFNSCIFVVYEEIFKESNFKNLINELDIKNLNYSNNFKSGNSYKLVSNFDKDLYTKSVLLYKKFNKNI